MNSSSSRTRGRVLRDPARFATADLGTVRSSAARDLVVDPALVEGAAEEGYRQGYDEGFTAGLEDAANAIESRERLRGEQLQQVLARLADEVDTVSDRHDDVVARIEGQVVEIAFEIARTILGRELRATDSAGADAIHRALQFAPPTGPVIARLHPDDVASIADPTGTLANRALTIVVDPTLSPGDAIVDVGAAHIDARIEPALARIREVLS
jgi:flagellar assembly protein FliH